MISDSRCECTVHQVRDLTKSNGDVRRERPFVFPIYKVFISERLRFNNETFDIKVRLVLAVVPRIYG